MKLAETQEFYDQLVESVEELQKAGVPAEALTEMEIIDLNVNPDSARAGATLYPSIGRLDPGEIVSHCSQAGQATGVSIETDTRVTDVVVQDGAVTAVETDIGELKPDVVINPAGPWSSIVNQMVGVDIPLKHTLAPSSVLETAENFDLPTVILENGVYFSGERSPKSLAGYAPHESSDGLMGRSVGIR